MTTNIDNIFTTELTPDYLAGYDKGRNDGVDGVLADSGPQAGDDYQSGYMDGWVDAQPCE